MTRVIEYIKCLISFHDWKIGIYGIRDEHGINYVNAKKCKRCGKIKYVRETK